MPELPEVETARSFVEDTIGTQRITTVWTQADTIVFSNASHLRLRRVLAGARIKAVRRKGKHMWLELEDGPHVAFHLGMTGWFETRSDDDDRLRFTKLEMQLEDGSWLAFINKRRLGRIRLHRDAATEPPIAALGWDPMHECPTPAKFHDMIRTRRTPIKALLLNQHFIAGIGNWIADEVLFQSGIHPATQACKLTRKETDTLRKYILNVIGSAVRVKADHRCFPKTWLFHHRWGKNANARTSKGDTLKYTEVGGRTTAYVPRVQKLKR